MTRSVIQFRLSPEEKVRVMTEAKRHDMTLSDYIRAKLLTEENPAEPVIADSTQTVRLERRIRQLHAQGLTTPVARRMAEAELS